MGELYLKSLKDILGSFLFWHLDLSKIEIKLPLKNFFKTNKIQNYGQNYGKSQFLKCLLLNLDAKFFAV